MITDISRDRNNNMWIGSYNGLYKHEGSRIRSLSKSVNDTISLSALEMHCVFEDKTGFIWVATTNGVDKINPFTYSIQHYKLLSPKDNSSFIGYIYSIFQDAEDSLWISTDAALYKINATTGKYRAIPQGKDSRSISGFAIGYNSGINTGKGIWFFTDGGMHFYDYSNKTFQHPYNNPDNKAVFTIRNKLVGAQSGMDADKQGNMWFVGNGNYLYRYHWDKNLLDSFAFNTRPETWNCCFSIKVDHRNNVWIGTRNGGLWVFETKTTRFTNLLAIGTSSLLSSNYIHALEEDYLGHMWISSDNGIDVIDFYNRGVSQKFLSKKENFINLAYQSAALTGNGGNKAYFPFYQYGFFSFDYNTDSISDFEDKPLKKNSGTVFVMPSFKKQGNYWIAKNKTLLNMRLNAAGDYQFDSAKMLPLLIEKTRGSVLWYYQYKPNEWYIRKNSGWLYHIKEGKMDSLQGYAWRKNLCLSFDSTALWYINGQLNIVKRNFQTLHNDTIALQSLLRNTNHSYFNPRDILDDGRYLWLTSQNGLIRYNYNNNSIKVYSTFDGLPHSFSFGLVTDDANKLWVLTAGGICLYDNKIDKFTTRLRFASTSYMEAFGSALKLGNGKLIFHIGNRFFVIDPTQSVTTYTKFQLNLEEMQVNNLPVNFLQSKWLASLAHDQNNILVRFGLLDFEKTNEYTFWYLLKGLQKNWISNGNQAELLFNEMPSGKYELLLKATDALGNDISNIVQLKFTILPPWWQTWWFRLLLILFGIAVIYYFFRRRLNAVRQKAAIQQQLAELEGKALRAQMNPHFIFNSLNAIQECIISGKEDAAYNYLSRFSKLLRMVLNNSEKNLISLQDEIDMLEIYLKLESLRFKNNFSYQIHIANNVEPEMCMIPPLLLQPYIENAIWHGLLHKEGNKLLELTCEEIQGALYCIITDNGIGRKKSAEIKQAKLGANQFESKGMQLSKQRIKILNEQQKNTFSTEIQDLIDVDNNPAGTKVTVKLYAKEKSL